ncbi:hypothetical protein ACFL20_13275 [Spirochaetota bacterium]
MRSKATNVLQVIVLLTGLVYIVIGILFYFSPIFVLEIFAESFPEEWLKQVINDEIVAPLYFISRGFSALVFTSGVAMVMPLYEPLRYRGLIYFNGLIFPLLSLFMFIVFPGVEIGIAISKSKGVHGHLLLSVFGVIFTVIFVLTAIGLIITRKLAKQGVE